ncbi:hypothetical protein [Aurantiacibacter xanthus]|uniref:hypothetical protein n=1 Tax=Aurantiacibacter xanthus TaxID=1784712 RepID=UPI001FE5C9EF|nr:hypothetical protein [Aurantiacibacter xanthus]
MPFDLGILIIQALVEAQPGIGIARSLRGCGACKGASHGKAPGKRVQKSGTISRHEMREP